MALKQLHILVFVYMSDSDSLSYIDCLLRGTFVFDLVYVSVVE